MHFELSGQRKGLPQGANLCQDEIFQEFGQYVEARSPRPKLTPAGCLLNGLLFPGVPQKCKYSVFSLVDMINRLYYLEKPNGNKKYSSVRSFPRLTEFVLVLAYSWGLPVSTYVDVLVRVPSQVNMCVPCVLLASRAVGQNLSPERSLFSASPVSEISPRVLLSVKAPPSVTVAHLYVK